MARGKIYVTAEIVMKDVLRLEGYTLQDVRVERALSGQLELVFVVEKPELPGEAEQVVYLLPIMESKPDEEGGQSWYRLKEVQVV